MTQPVAWHINASNLAEHARNPIHTDAGAQAAGFPRALVAGVTTYAYLTHPLIVAWGENWLHNGGGEVRFRRPVFDGDVLRCVPTNVDESTTIDAITDEPDQPRAQFVAVQDSGTIAAMRPGEVLPELQIPLLGEWGSDYGQRAGDDLDFCLANNYVHPAVWPALANNAVHQFVARGSWIHTRSIIRHHGIAHGGSVAAVKSTVVRRFQSHGERAILDVQIKIDGRIIATLEHEAIIALP